MADGTSMYAFSSLTDLAATSDLVVEARVLQTRLGDAVATGASTLTPRYLQMEVVSTIKGSPPDQLWVYDANLESNGGRDFKPETSSSVLVIYTDLQIEVGDRLIVALVESENVEAGTYTVNTPSGFFPLTSEGAAPGSGPDRRNPVATDARKLSAEELRVALSS